MPILATRGAMSARGFGMFGLVKAASLGGTWDSGQKTTNIVLSGGSLVATETVVGGGAVNGTISRSSGKWYFECTPSVTVAPVNAIGIASSAHTLTNNLGYLDSESVGYEPQGNIRAATNTTNIAANAYGVGSTIGVAVDVTNHLIYFSQGGNWQNAANPSAGTGGIDYITTSPVFPASGLYATGDVRTINLGGSAFTYTVPAGFSPW